jgi:hypothetical protein
LADLPLPFTEVRSDEEDTEEDDDEAEEEPPLVDESSLLLFVFLFFAEFEFWLLFVSRWLLDAAVLLVRDDEPPALEEECTAELELEACLEEDGEDEAEDVEDEAEEDEGRFRFEEEDAREERLEKREKMGGESAGGLSSRGSMFLASAYCCALGSSTQFFSPSSSISC